MQATHRGELNLIPLINTWDITDKIFPQLHFMALISIGQICDHGCISIFTAMHIKAEKKLHLVLEGHLKVVVGMCQVNLTETSHPRQTPTRQSSNNLLVDRTKP